MKRLSAVSLAVLSVVAGAYGQEKADTSKRSLPEIQVPPTTTAAPAVTGIDTVPHFLPAREITIGGRRVTLSREQCIKIALEQSQTIRIADLEVTRTDWSKRRCRLNCGPPYHSPGPIREPSNCRP